MTCPFAWSFSHSIVCRAWRCPAVLAFNISTALTFLSLSRLFVCLPFHLSVCVCMSAQISLDRHPRFGALRVAPSVRTFSARVPSPGSPRLGPAQKPSDHHRRIGTPRLHPFPLVPSARLGSPLLGSRRIGPPWIDFPGFASPDRTPSSWASSAQPHRIGILDSGTSALPSLGHSALRVAGSSECSVVWRSAGFSRSVLRAAAPIDLLGSHPLNSAPSVWPPRPGPSDRIPWDRNPRIGPPLLGSPRLGNPLGSEPSRAPILVTYSSAALVLGVWPLSLLR